MHCCWRCARPAAISCALYLTILGIVIGVTAFIVMVTIGGGAMVQASEQIASLGSNLLMVTPGQRMGPGQRSAAPPFKLEDAAAIGREIDSVQTVAPSSSKSVTAVFGNRNWNTRITGTDNRFFQAGGRRPSAGRQFTESELHVGKAVCLPGATAREALFGGQDPLGSRLRLEKVSCQVIVLLEAKGQTAMGTDQDDLIVVPLRTFQRRIAGNQDVGLISRSRSGTAYRRPGSSGTSNG